VLFVAQPQLKRQNSSAVPLATERRVLPKLSAPSGNVFGMANQSEVLMLSGVTAQCADCGGKRIFLPVDDGSGDTFCCTSCDAAVFLLEVLDNTGGSRRSAA